MSELHFSIGDLLGVVVVEGVTIPSPFCFEVTNPKNSTWGIEMSYRGLIVGG